MTPRRIVLSINTAWNIYNFRRGLVRALVEAGFEVVAVAPPDEWSNRLANIGCRFVPIHIDSRGSSAFRDLRLFAAYRHILKTERPVAFLGFTIKPNIYGSLAANTLSIPTINNVSGLGTVFVNKTWVTIVAQLLYKVALRSAARVFFQNRDDMELFVQQGLVQPRSGEVLPGSGVDLHQFMPTPLPSSMFDAPPVFLLIARLLADKGVREFVEAARLVKRQHPKVRFQLLGFLEVENRTAISRDAVNAWVSDGLVEYLGSTDDVRPFIQGADCVVLPSYREGTPRALLEAAAMGRPLITTDVPGCRDVVESGVNGLLCTARNSHALSTAVMEMIDLGIEGRAAMGVQSRRIAVERYDERIVVHRYLDALASLSPGCAKPGSQRTSNGS